MTDLLEANTGARLEMAPVTSQDLRRHRFQVVIDSLLVVAASLAAVFLRYDFSTSRVLVGPTLALVSSFGAVVVVIGAVLGLYKGRWKFGSYEEIGHVTATLALASATTITAQLAWPRLRGYLPLGASILCFGFALIALAGVRYLWRLVEEHLLVQASSGGRRVLVAGAGEAGEQIVRALRVHPENGRTPVGLLDDDPGKRNRVFYGVKVLGRFDQLRRVAALSDAEELLIAIPSANGELVTRLSDQAERAGLSVTVLPSALELMTRGGRVEVDDIRKVSIEDLLGREPVEPDLGHLATYVVGRTVLVTGAGGSIGTELCRQLQALNPLRIILFDHDETNLHSLQLELRGQALLDNPEVVVGDVRDRTRLEVVWDRHHPDVVFHVAAHKHLPLLEMHPCEGVKTNVLGTLNVALISARKGCSRVINVSTDKAAEPTSVLGASKRVAELVCQRVGEQYPQTVFASVRFGNVLGSRGSVVPVFERQIAAGGPVTLTHPDATRYFMTIPEAAHLVIHAGALAKSGEVFVLDMGRPVRIQDLAEKMIALAGRPALISYTGLRRGEKLHETLFFEEEMARSAVQADQKIFSCAPAPLDPDFDAHLEELIDAAHMENPEQVLRSLSLVEPRYAPTREPATLGALYPDGY